MASISGMTSINTCARGCVAASIAFLHSFNSSLFLNKNKKKEKKESWKSGRKIRKRERGIPFA